MKSITDFKFYDWQICFPELKILVDSYDEIKQEYIANKDKIEWEDMHLGTGYNIHSKAPEYIGWRMSPLHASATATLLDMEKSTNDKPILSAETIERYSTEKSIDFPNAKLFPKLSNAIKKAQPKNALLNVRNAFVCLDPGTILDWHTDIDNPNYQRNGLLILRTHWGMDVIPEQNKTSFLEVRYKGITERKTNYNNQINIFWGHMKHRAVNELSTDRVVISMDMLIHANELTKRINL
jgi:Aspartyl/Asparaginyl beta-hydroxylase